MHFVFFVVQSAPPGRKQILDSDLRRNDKWTGDVLTAPTYAGRGRARRSRRIIEVLILVLVSASSPFQIGITPESGGRVASSPRSCSWLGRSNTAIDLSMALNPLRPLSPATPNGGFRPHFLPCLPCFPWFNLLRPGAGQHSPIRWTCGVLIAPANPSVFSMV